MLWYLRNTLIVTVTATVFGVLTASLAGYAFARLRFPGRNILFSLCLSTLMLPGIVTLIPEFLLFRQIGWINTFLPLIVPWSLGGHALGIFLFRQYALTIPMDFDEAARVDGAGALPDLVEHHPAALGAGPGDDGDPGVHPPLERLPATAGLPPGQGLADAGDRAAAVPQRVPGPVEPADGGLDADAAADPGAVLRGAALLRAGHRDERPQGVGGADGRRRRVYAQVTRTTSAPIATTSISGSTDIR